MLVKVHYLFSKNNKIGSKLISWGTSHLSDITETPSHIAVLINERWVFESTLTSGVRVISYKKWLQINTEIKKVACVQIYRKYSEIKKIYKELLNKKYDYLGVLYLGIHLGLNRFFKKSIPIENKWENKNRYFCCEAAEKLTDIGPTQMMAPIQILDMFKLDQ